jgi:hypothetical protein
MLRLRSRLLHRTASIAWTLLLSVLLTAACGGVTSQVEETAPASPEAQFDQALLANLKAAEKHFWEVIDCENRDPENGLPTTKVPLPGATRTFLESAEYTLYSFFPKEGLGQSDLHGFVRARMAANTHGGYSYTYSSSPDSGDSTLSHDGNPEGFPSVELSEESGMLQVIFYPAQKAEIPWGNACAHGKP